MAATFIYSAKRSAIASFQGSLSQLSAPEIAASVIKDTLKNFEIEKLNEVYMGCVAGLPSTTLS